MQPIYGLIGRPLTHSFSPSYFRKKFEREAIDAVYQAFELDHINRFPELLAANPELAGLNVTIPYKSAVIPFLDSLSEGAKAIGAVNCIEIRSGRLIGHNTDTTAFGQTLPPLIKGKNVKALVLGTGGASLAIQYALKKIGISFLKVSRNAVSLAVSYNDLTPELVRAHQLIINTTPLGMFPDKDAAPAIPYEAVSYSHILYDLIYNPEETKFLKLGKAQGATVKNGQEMLVLQAEASWEIWSKGVR